MNAPHQFLADDETQGPDHEKKRLGHDPERSNKRFKGREQVYAPRMCHPVFPGGYDSPVLASRVHHSNPMFMTREASTRAMEMIRMPLTSREQQQWQQEDYGRWSFNVDQSSPRRLHEYAPNHPSRHVSALLSAATELSDLDWMSSPPAAFQSPPLYGLTSGSNHMEHPPSPTTDSYTHSQAPRYNQGSLPDNHMAVFRNDCLVERRPSMHHLPLYMDRRLSFPVTPEPRPRQFMHQGSSHGYNNTWPVVSPAASMRGSPREPPCRVLPAPLSGDSDAMVLSPHQVFLRLQIEVFVAGHVEVSTHTRGRNKPIRLGQVGLRCRYCAHVPLMQRQKGSSYYPATLLGVYQAAQNMSTNHMQCGLCSHMPDAVKQEFADLIPSKSINSGCGRTYWSDSARKQFDLIDTDDGIFCRDAVEW